jgi:hypothetical protein
MDADLDTIFTEAFNAATEGGEGVDDGTSDLTGVYGADVNTGVQPEDTTGGVEVEDDGENLGDDPELGTPDPELFDVSSYENQIVELTVAGQKVRMTVKEALSGSMRQADYTRKTQQNAELIRAGQWAQELRQAFQTDPQGAIKYLSQVFQVQPQQAPNDPYADLDEDFQPIVRELQATKAQLARLEAQHEQNAQEQVLASVKSEMAEVQAEFSDFDPYEVLPVALQKGLTIRDAYFLTNSQKLMQAQRDAAAAAAKAAKQAEAEATKRKVTKKVASGRGPAGAEGTAVPSFDSFGDMLRWNMENSRS